MIERQDMHVYVDNLTYENNTVNHNLSDIINYITQYRFQGGPEQPIRYLEMKVNKNDIDSANPELMHSIVEGKTRLLVDAVDGGTFIITKIWLKDNEYDIVATGIEVTLNTATLTSAMAQAVANLDPPKIIETIFNDWVETLDLTDDDGFRLYLSDSVSLTRTPPGYKIGFKVNMPTLVAMNMCALLDDAFIFFANKDWTENGVTKKYNTMFYVRYSDIKPLAYNPGDESQNGVVNIYPRLDSQYVDYTRFDLLMFKRLIGLSSKNSEGSETIVNNQIVSMEGGRGDAHNTYSERMYGDYAGTAVMSDLMISYDVTIEGVATSTAQIIAENLVRRYKDPTRSITIELTEINNTDTGSGWEGIIEPFSYAYKINDNVNNITLTNTHLCEPDGSPDKIDDFMLRLTTFVRAYPEMTTEYTFGVMKETTLSQELANKLTGMSGTIADIRYMGTSVANNGIVTIDQDGSHNPVSSDGTYDAIQSAIHGVAPQGTIGTDTKPLKLLNGTLVGVTYDLAKASQLTDGSVTKVGTGNKGSGTQFIYLNAGVPTATTSTTGSDTKPLKLSSGTLTPVTNELATKSSVDNIINGTTTVAKATNATNATTSASCSGTSASANKLNTDAGSSSHPVYFSNGIPVQCSRPIIKAGYTSGSNSGLRIPSAPSDWTSPPSAVIVTPRYKGSSPDYPADGWTISGPFRQSSSYYVYVYHGSGVIDGWNWIAVWMP